MTTIPEIDQAVAVLRDGGLVAFPTETVYGLGADARNEAAIDKIYQAKQRPANHPLIVHIASLEQLHDWALNVPSAALKLAQAFWPGPLTLILKKQPQVLAKLTAGQETVGLRMPRHPVALALLQAFASGIAAPSANQFTRISPTTAADVRDELGDKVDLILDGGACEVGLESTIIDMSQEVPLILRPGMVTPQAIEAVLQVKVNSKRQDIPQVLAPGMHHVHYAPTTKTLLVATKQLLDLIRSLQPAQLPVAVVTWSDVKLPQHDQIHHVNMAADANQYAHDVYHTLRVLDHQRFNAIIIEAVPESTEWGAIRDRLVKASGGNQ